VGPVIGGQVSVYANKCKSHIFDWMLISRYMIVRDTDGLRFVASLRRLSSFASPSRSAILVLIRYLRRSCVIIILSILYESNQTKNPVALIILAGLILSVEFEHCLDVNIFYIIPIHLEVHM
jgi:hypothetical protein